MYKGFLTGIIFYLLICIGRGEAQTLNPYKYKKEPAIGIHFSLYDFNSAFLLRTAGLSQLLRSSSFTQVGYGNTAQAGLLNVSALNGSFDNILSLGSGNIG